MNVLQILTRANIQFVEHGKNVARSNVNLKCPWCGSLDPSEHLGINITTGAWGCLRNAEHRGRKLKSLLVKLVGVVEADRLLEDTATSPDNFDNVVANMETSKNPLTAIKPIEFPANFLDLSDELTNLTTSLVEQFDHYIRMRGFTDCEWSMSWTYDLQCCYTGEWKSRIILPITNWEDQLIGWYGRAVVKSKLRYKAHPADNTVKTSVFNLYNAKAGGDKLFICEGPFDAIKMDYYGIEHNCAAVSIQGTSASSAQLAIISRLRKLYGKVIILLDNEALSEALYLQQQLAFCNASVECLPSGVKDPGELDSAGVERLCKL